MEFIRRRLQEAEVDDLCDRWYMKSKSLTINGEGNEDLKSQLKAIVCVMESDAGASQQPIVSEVVESDNEPECESVLFSYTLGNPAIQSPAASVLELVQSLEERLECKFEKLASQILACVAGLQFYGGLICNGQDSSCPLQIRPPIKLRACHVAIYGPLNSNTIIRRLAKFKN